LALLAQSALRPVAHQRGQAAQIQHLGGVAGLTRSPGLG